MNNDNTHFWLWLFYAALGAFILVNVAGRWQLVLIAIIVLGAFVAMQANGGSVQDFIKTLSGGN